MAERTGIQWTDATWNPITGCSKVSPGCAHCYAEAWSHRRGWTGEPWTPANANDNVVLHPARLELPLSWRAPRMVFVCSMADLFHERVPDEYIARVWQAMLVARAHTFQVLTKRAERMARWLAACDEWEGWITHDGTPPTAYGGTGVVVGSRDSWPLPNVWLGVSIENCRFVDRADVLRDTPAAVRFISAEPLLGPLMADENVAVPCLDERADPGEPVEWDLLPFWTDRSEPGGPDEVYLSGIDWLIIGGESGPRARPMDLKWARDLLAFGRQADTAVFVKQLGSRWSRQVGARDRLGGDPGEWPEDLRVRQWPAALEATA